MFCVILKSHIMHTIIIILLHCFQSIALVFCCILMNSNWDIVGFVKMIEKITNFLLLVINYDDIFVKGGVRSKITTKSTRKGKKIEEILIAKAKHINKNNFFNYK